MGNLTLQLSKIVGTSTHKGWSQIHVFLPKDPKKLTRRGQLLAVISLEELKEDLEIIVFGREIISRLHEEYYRRLDGSPLEQLEKAVKRVTEEAGPQTKVEIAAAAVVDQVLYLVVNGQGKLMLNRKGKTATILSGEGSASGCLVQGDVFFLGTSQIFAVIPEEKLKAVLAVDSPEEITETLLPLIHTREESGTMAAISARVGQGVKKETVSPLRLLAGRAKSFFPPIYLSQEKKSRRRSKKTALSVALILLLILGASVILGRRQRTRLAQNKQLTDLLEKVQTKKEEGEALLELNPIKAKELLLEAQALVQSLDPRAAASSKEAADLKQALEAVLSRVVREHQAEPKVFFDLELVKVGARGDDWDFSTGSLFILDKGRAEGEGGSTVYSLGVVDRKSAIVAGGDRLGRASHIAALSSQVFILTTGGVVQAEIGAGEAKTVISADEEWKEAVDFQTFGGNLYFLQKKSGIGRYRSAEGGFGSRQSWLKDQEFNFSEAVSMAIDGAIWVLKTNGAIEKYLQGKKDAFGIAGLDKPLFNPTDIYTNEKQERLYVLDKGNSRVVVLAKSGEYDSQYYWEGMGEASGLVALEEEKKILLLKGSKIYEIEMK